MTTFRNGIPTSNVGAFTKTPRKRPAKSTKVKVDIPKSVHKATRAALQGVAQAAGRPLRKQDIADTKARNKGTTYRERTKPGKLADTLNRMERDFYNNTMRKNAALRKKNNGPSPAEGDPYEVREFTNRIYKEARADTHWYSPHWKNKPNYTKKQLEKAHGPGTLRKRDDGKGWQYYTGSDEHERERNRRAAKKGRKGGW